MDEAMVNRCTLPLLLQEIFFTMQNVGRVNMPPIGHHSIIKHPFYLVNGHSPLCKHLNATL
jgi:hypothetical protein